MPERYARQIAPQSQGPGELSSAAINIGSGSGDRCTTNRTRRATRDSHNGSIYRVGLRFKAFIINDLELVAQIFPRWNPLTSWMRQIEDFQRAA